MSTIMHSKVEWCIQVMDLRNAAITCTLEHRDAVGIEVD